MPLRTGDNNFGTAKWIVSAAYSDGCTHTTIASALTSASSGDTIFIRPGTYTENLTLKAGVNLVAYTADAFTPTVTIIGKCSFSSAGTVGISGIRLETNSDNLLAVTGSAASKIYLNDCYLNMTNATGIAFSSSDSGAYIVMTRSEGNIGMTGITLFTHSSAGTLEFKYTDIRNTGGTTTRSTCSSGGLFFRYSDIDCPVTTSGTGFIGMGFSNITGRNVAALIHGGRTDSSIQHSTMQGLNSPSLTVNANLAVYHTGFFSSSNPCINGSATLTGTGIYFTSSSQVTCTYLTKVSLMGTILENNQMYITSGAGSPNGVITAPKGSFYMRTDGSGTTNRAYINTNATTGWTALTTAS